MPNPMLFGHDVCRRYIPQQNQLIFVAAKWLQREIGVWMATSREIEDSMIGDDIVFGIDVIQVVVLARGGGWRAAMDRRDL